jgi:hypothetical protein
MKPSHVLRSLSAFTVFLVLFGLLSCTTDKSGGQRVSANLQLSEMAQVPSWSRQDLDFFLHGSMSTEVVPEAVLRAFISTYPDLFASRDLSHLGLIPDPAFGWPVGFSRKNVPHLGGLSAVGLNCAACHVTDVTTAGAAPVRVLGVTSHFDAEAFFGAVIVATFRTADPANMKKFLSAYLAASDPAAGEGAQEFFAHQWQSQEQYIIATMADDPSGSKGLVPGALHSFSPTALRLEKHNLDSVYLPTLSHSMLQLFHNMRAALHVPDQPPDKAPPASGPGRNDAFGLLSAALFGAPQPYAPVKYGLVWNVENRHWVHWDGNTQSPLGRNLLAALGLGAPLIDKHGELDFTLVKRQTDLSEHIRAPRYPFAIDSAAAKRGAAHYQSLCAACHDGPETDTRLHAPSEVGTEPTRAVAFTQVQADRFNKFLTDLEIPGYRPPQEPGIRGTQKYWAASLAGVWARSPYLHNGSVRTMQELLTPPPQRAKSFHRGSRTYDTAQMGYVDEGAYVLETSNSGNSNAGHDYSTNLSSSQKHELIEFLKTL